MSRKGYEIGSRITRALESGIADRTRAWRHLLRLGRSKNGNLSIRWTINQSVAGNAYGERLG